MMRPIIDPTKQKFIIILIAALGSFFGFQALGQILQAYQIPQFIRVSFYIYLFLVFLQTFIFDLHLKKVRTLEGFERSFVQGLKQRFEYLKEKHHFLHFQNYLILPGISYWATVALLYLNPFDELLKQVFVIFSTIALATNFWYLKTVFYAHRDASYWVRQAIFLIKLYASYLAFAAAFGITRYFDYGAEWFGVVVLALTFFLFYQALFQHHTLGAQTLKFLLPTVFFLGLSGFFIYNSWNVNYFSGALVLTALYQTIWGIVHHKYIDQNLTREMVYEYLAVLFVILVIVFSSTNFAERI